MGDDVAEWPSNADPAAPGELVDRAIAHGVAPLAARRLVEHPGHGWPQSLCERLDRIEAEAVALAMLRERELPRAPECLAGRGGRPVIIKGPALSHPNCPTSHLP